MPASLKSLLPALSVALNEDSEAALYERQRALVRAGLLQFSPGKGPGSGVRATPEAVAMLLIARLASVNWSEATTKAREIAAAQAVSGRCPLTRATNFKDALAAILSDERLAKRVTAVNVTATHGAAEIVCRSTKSMFAGPASGAPGMRVTIGFGPEIVQALAKIVAGIPT